MSEYITIDVEPTEDPQVVIIHTNLTLAPGGDESYPDAARGETGSPLAQALFAIDGVSALTIAGGDLIVTRSPDMELFSLVDEIDAALKDFFL